MFHFAAIMSPVGRRYILGGLLLVVGRHEQGQGAQLMQAKRERVNDRLLPQPSQIEIEPKLE
jgi:hypothetical protein